MGSKTTKKTSNESAQTRPVVPSYAEIPTQNYYSQLDGFVGSNFNPFTPANEIQNTAFGNYGNLTPGNTFINQAIGNTQAGYWSPQVQDRDLARAQVGSPADLGDPSKVDLSGVLAGSNAQTAGQGIMAGGGSATAGKAIDYYKPYVNPYLEGVVATTLGDMDVEAGKQRAAYNADAARNRAFGDSGYYFGGAQLEGNLARARSAADANLRFGAYDRAFGLGAGDADRETSAQIANANNATSASIANANNDAQRLMFNAGEQNKFGLAGLSGQIQAALANAGYQNQFRLADFDAANQFGLAQFGADNANNQLAYQTGTENDRFNADMGMDFNRLEMDRNTQLANLGQLLNNNAMAVNSQQLELGNALRAIQEDETMAPAQKLQIFAELLNGGGLLNTITGQNVTSQGTSTTKESGGGLGQVLGAALQLGSMFIPGVGPAVSAGIGAANSGFSRNFSGLNWS